MLLSKTALTTVGASAGLADDHITAVYANHRASDRDELWIATWSGPMYKIAGGKPVPIPLPGVNLRTLSHTQCCEDSRGTLWLGSNNAGVIHLDHGIRQAKLLHDRGHAD